MNNEYLLVALENLLEFLEPDSLLDQQTDVRLRIEREWAVEAAKRAVAIAKGEK